MQQKKDSDSSQDTIPFQPYNDEPLRIEVASQKIDKIAYKDLSETEYVWLTISVYLVAVFSAVTIKDISSVFNFVAAISVNSMAFFFPATFFLKTEDYADRAIRRKYHAISKLFLLIGVSNFVMGIAAAILNL